VALAAGIRNPVFVPGHIGERAAHRHFRLRSDQVIEDSNEWGYMLDQAVLERIPRLLVLGHPGKLVKLARGAWDTHSSRSGSALPYVQEAAARHFPGTAVEGTTVEGFLMGRPDDTRTALSDLLAGQVLGALADKTRGTINLAVFLVNLRGDRLGSAGDLSPWT
jgi:cobalt-precorrin-5B (C1)-methyltransferase